MSSRDLKNSGIRSVTSLPLNTGRKMSIPKRPPAITRTREGGRKINKREQFQKSPNTIVSQSTVDITRNSPDLNLTRSKNLRKFFTDLASVKRGVDLHLEVYLHGIKKEKQTEKIQQLASISQRFKDQKASQIWFVEVYFVIGLKFSHI